MKEQFVKSIRYDQKIQYTLEQGDFVAKIVKNKISNALVSEIYEWKITSNKMSKEVFAMGQEDTLLNAEKVVKAKLVQLKRRFHIS